MKLFLLGLMLFLAVPTFTNVQYSPEEEILGVSFVQEAYADSLELAPVVAEAKDAVVSDEKVEPYFTVVKDVLAILTKQFPKVGPLIQAATEIIGGLASFFTLLSVFLIGALKIPAIVARYAGAGEMADKISGFNDKLQYWIQKLSIFNVQKKK